MTTPHNKAKVLVVLPTLGQRITYLKQTLESIAQHPRDLYDIVLIYPLKNKEVAALAKQYSATSIEDPGGLSAALNAGIATAKPHHKFISWIGDDDLLAPDSLVIASTALERRPDAVVAYGYCDYIDDKGNLIFTSKAGSLAPWIMKWGPNLLPLPGALFTQAGLKKAGEFDVTNKQSMDLDMFLRLQKFGKFINTRTILASFRWHSDSMTVSNRSSVLKESEMVKRKYLPPYLRPISFVWNFPVRIATRVAAKTVSKRMKNKA